MRVANISLVILGLFAIGAAQTTPVITSVIPAQNELGAPVTTSISVSFNINMDETTINNSSFVVNSRSTGRHSGGISYNSDTQTATMVPDEWFSGGERVTVSLTTAIQSSEGVPLESNFVWSFTTTVPAGVDVFAPQQEYPTHLSPTSVYMADVTGDGDLDIATANQDGASVSILVNNGDSTFADPVNYSVGDFPTTLTAGDLDGDGDTDIATCSRRFDNVSILLNHGDGTFADQMGYPTGESPVSIVSVDLDGDGDLDIATANLWSNDVTVLLNNGDGTFGSRLDINIGDKSENPVIESRWRQKLASLKHTNNDLYMILSEYPAGHGPYSITAGDLDKDGDVDLATANLLQNNISILMNNGDGTFAPAIFYSAGENPSSVCFVDVNGDRDLDLACANMGSNSVFIYLNVVNGDLSFSGSFPVGEFPVEIFGADFDGDTDIDIASANSWSNDVTLLYNDGTGDFPTTWNYQVGATPFSVFAGDYTGNGAVDLASANSGANSVTLLMNVPGCDYYLPGDFNNNGRFNVVDIIAMHSKLANGSPDPGFTCDCAGREWGVVGDVNNSCTFNISDVIDGFNFLKTGSPPIFPCDQCLPRHP